MAIRSGREEGRRLIEESPLGRRRVTTGVKDGSIVAHGSSVLLHQIASPRILVRRSSILAAHLESSGVAVQAAVVNPSSADRDDVPNTEFGSSLTLLQMETNRIGTDRASLPFYPPRAWLHMTLRLYGSYRSK